VFFFKVSGRYLSSLRRGGELSEHELDPHPVFAFDTDPYRQEVETLLAPLGLS
jgi:hypothetical protein